MTTVAMKRRKINEAGVADEGAALDANVGVELRVKSTCIHCRVVNKDAVINVEDGVVGRVDSASSTGAGNTIGNEGATLDANVVAHGIGNCTPRRRVIIIVIYAVVDESAVLRVEVGAS